MNEIEKQYNQLRELSFIEYRNLVFGLQRNFKYNIGLKAITQLTIDNLLGKETNQSQENFDFLPTMVSKAEQVRWTGTFGKTLVKLTYDFVILMLFHCGRLGLNIGGETKVLDFGCGWGRMTRFFPYFTGTDNIYGVDPTQESIDLCHSHKVPGNYFLINHIPESLPIDSKMDLVYAYSVFTHMKDNVAANAMKILRQQISENGILCITIRPRNYWKANISGGKMSKLEQEVKLSDHDKNGYAFISYADNSHGGTSIWGDATYSLDYIQRNWNDWEILKYDFADSDPYQILVFLKPV